MELIFLIYLSHFVPITNITDPLLTSALEYIYKSECGWTN